MNFDEYVRRIDFHIYKPHKTFRMYATLSKLAARFGISLEIVNTKLPQEAMKMKHKLGPLCAIPKMSTFAIGAIINRAVFQMPNCTSFVNVGVWHGFTLIAGMIGNSQKNCIGVDNFSQFDGPRNQFFKKFQEYKNEQHHFYDMDYVDYFSKVHSSAIGFYIYDGEHSYDNQLNGLKMAESFFSENCIILVDDINWHDPRQATLDFIKSSTNKYEILLDKTTSFNGHPTYWNGIMIFRKS